MKQNQYHIVFLSFLMMLSMSALGFAAVESNVSQTAHNLSASGPGPVKASTEDRVCVFCHTPHAATSGIVAPLWNRQLSTATYTTYSSSSIDANTAELAEGPGGSSKLCLSCHDGTMAIGSVNVLNGSADGSVDMLGTEGGRIASGEGAQTGFTRNIGVDLTNDHPISFTYDDELADADGELYRVSTNDAVGNRTATHRPQFPLENGKVQCTTCHDPHLWESDTTKGNRKFLRGHRFQQQAPTGGDFASNSDIVCLACHDRAGQAWSNSAHANPLVADEKYLSEAAQMRDFPENLEVWQAACQNCHDTHTVQGARRLIREGTDSTATPKSGGESAIEETCYQCHSNVGTSVLASVDTVPDIKSAFNLPYRMPISNADQLPSTEVHDIGTGIGQQLGKDFVEGQQQLGLNNLNNRHAECTDCHNPHRVVKNYTFYGNNGDTSVPDDQGTHQHTNDGNTRHTNIASGVLRGTFGVEPIYSSNSFHEMPSGFNVKRGDPGLNTTTAVSASYVTREYQICLKCHSNYGYADNNMYPNGNRPRLGDTGGSTPSGTHGLTMFTNQAKEFYAPVTHRGEGVSVGADGGAGSDWNTNNHRSWHPVMDKTGRGTAERGMVDTSAFVPPWNNDVGNQTMYCSDCHGSSTPSRSVIPMGGVDGDAWGPHGSTNPFLLKGNWLQVGGRLPTDDDFLDDNFLCFKCHDRDTYAGRVNTGANTGFSNSGVSGFNMFSSLSGAPSWSDYDGGYSTVNLHNYHAFVLYNVPLMTFGSSTFKASQQKMRCTWCHAAVPHGWKNKALLVNLNDIGAEAGYPGQSKEATLPAVGYFAPTVGDEFLSRSEGYTQEPYYYKAILKVRNFKPSGQWNHLDCASAGKSGDDLIDNPNYPDGTTNNGFTLGLGWMRTSCARLP